MINKKLFGNINGKSVYEYSLTNKNNIKISCISYGAALTKIITPDKNGTYSNILLDFDDLESYVKDNAMFLGESIGRVGGRITNGCFKINGNSYEIPKNEGKNTLHGGNHGFNTIIWDSKIMKSTDGDSIVFYKSIKPEEDGFPGALYVQIVYTLNDNNDLLITFNALSDKDTLFNPTLHSYFNLNNDITKLLSGHKLQINASHYAEINEELLPTGNLKEVSGTPFDFIKPKDMNQAFDELKNKLNLNGFDHPFNVDDKNVLTLTNDNTGRCLSIESDRNALIVYTLNSIDGTWKSQNQKMLPHMGIALEPQTLPDAINHKNFGDIILHANEKKSYNIKYHFGLI